MENKTLLGIYVIDNFSPGDGSFQSCGIGITLHGDAVRQIVQHKRDPESPLIKEMLKMRRGMIGESQDAYCGRAPEFFEDTWLLTGMKAGNNCACFGISGSARSQIASSIESNEPDFRNLRYTCHNIDNTVQSSMLVMTWLHWFNVIISLTSIEQPFARS